MKKRVDLKDYFFKLLSGQKIPCARSEFHDVAAKNVYKEMTRKLCNIRINEFMSSQKQRNASKSGHASTTGQNLCDTLLTQHLNLQTRIKMD